MRPCVLDCSVAVSWVFEDEASERWDGLLRGLPGVRAVVPAVLWDLEVANVLLVATRKGRLALERSRQHHGFLDRLPLERRAVPRASDVFELAARHGLTSYDAAYLAIAQRDRLRLASADGTLCSAASEEGVPLFAD